MSGSMITYYQFKRVVDATVAGLALLLLLPFMLPIMLWIKLDGGPIFYGHTRVGKGHKLFKCWKLRSMVCDSDQLLATYLQQNPQAAAMWTHSRKLPHDPRVTGVGKWLRKTSLDELPQLWNVIRGDMAIVGPRPVTSAELTEYYHFYADCYTSVRPGITGLWQVSGRSKTSYDQRVMLDVKYAHAHNFQMDLAILWKTPRAVLMRSGAY
jgi:hypothetical protein